MTIYCTEKLHQFLDASITTSSDATKPPRTPYRRTRNDRTGKLFYKHIHTPHIDPLLVRARNGHSRSRNHLKHIRIEASDECRLCHDARETIAHQVLHCQKLPRMNIIQHARTKYLRQSLCEADFFDLIWATETKPVERLLRAAQRAGAYI